MDHREPGTGQAALPTGAARRAIETLSCRLPEGGGALSTTLFLDAQLALVDDMLLYFDRMSMAHSLEVRVPYLDHKVVEFCATIPSEFKVNGSVTKRVLKEAARGLLPSEIINRKKIGFFRQATTAWFETQSDGAVKDVLLDPGARYQTFLNRSAVEMSLMSHRRSGNEDISRQLITLLMLELWLAHFTPSIAAV
jgi:asparagine synthase (glutamine-hydrolysing)